MGDYRSFTSSYEDRDETGESREVKFWVGLARESVMLPIGTVGILGGNRYYYRVEVGRLGGNLGRLAVSSGFLDVTPDLRET